MWAPASPPSQEGPLSRHDPIHCYSAPGGPGTEPDTRQGPLSSLDGPLTLRLGKSLEPPGFSHPTLGKTMDVVFWKFSNL